MCSHAKKLTKESRKVFFVCGNWLEDSGGGRKVVSKIINELHARGNFSYGLVDFESRMFSVPKNSDIGLKDGISFYTITSALFKRNAIVMFARFIRLMWRERPDVIIETSGPTLKVINFLLLKIFLPRSRMPAYIFFDHSPVQTMLANSKYSFLYTVIAPYAYRRVDVAASVSEELIKSAAHKFGVSMNRIAYIHNPMDYEYIAKQAKEDVDHPWFRHKDLPIITTAARLDPFQKDIPTALKAFTRVVKTIPSRFVILGVGPQEEELKKMAYDLGISESVLFAGYQKNPYKYFARSDIFVLSTKFEAFGLVLAEAMACGCPVISSDCDFGPREVLEGGKDGILVPVGDIQKMSEAFLRLLANKEERMMFVARGKERVKDFSLDRALDAYETLFLRVLR